MKNKEELQMTGERLLTSVINQNTIEHLHRYAFACEFAKNKKVLDIACGEGYGSMLLSKEAFSVVGADISEEAVAHAKSKYKKDNLDFIQCSADNISLDTDSIELLVSFETIEHLVNQEGMLSEIKRVLKDDGVLIMSSPDKICNTDLENYTNPYHVKELYENEFKDLINKNFKNTLFLKQRIDILSIIQDTTKQSDIKYYSGDYNKVERIDKFEPSIWIAIASNEKLPEIDFAPFFRSDIVTSDLINTINNADYYRDLLLSYENLWSFKIAKLMVKPFKLMKKILKKSLSIFK